MRLLLDTNVFLEAVFNQPQAMNARLLLNNASHELFISDFSLHSVGVQLVRRRSTNHWRRFLNDLILYVTAEHHHLTLVSFDSDFDKTQRGRQTPQVINQLNFPNTPTPQE